MDVIKNNQISNRKEYYRYRKVKKNLIAIILVSSLNAQVKALFVKITDKPEFEMKIYGRNCIHCILLAKKTWNFEVNV